MSVIRVGSTEKYAAGWEAIFGGRKAAKKTTAKKAAAKKAKKPAAKKSAAKKPAGRRRG
jgi:hypothetical protein